MISKGFLKSTFIYTIGGALPMLSSVFLVFFYTQYLTTADYGTFALYLAFTLLVQILVNFGFDSAVGIYYYEYRDNAIELKKYISTVVSSLLLGGIGVAAIFAMVGRPLFDAVYVGQISFYPYGFMSVLTAIFNSFFRTYTNLLINRQVPERYLVLNLINFGLTIAISLTGLLLFPYTLVGPMWGRLLSGICIFAIALYYFVKEYGLGFHFSLFRATMPVTLPLVAFYILNWALSYLDRNIILGFEKMQDVGVFDFATKCIMGIEVLQGALINSINPKVFSIWKDKKLNHSTPEVNSYFNTFTALSILIAGGSILLLPYAIPLLVRKPEYLMAFQYIPLLAVAYASRGLYMMYLAPIYFFKKTKLLTLLFLFMAIFQLTGSYFLIQYFGLWGAAFALILIRPVQILLMHTATKSFFSFSYNTTKLIMLPLFYTLAVVGLELYYKQIIQQTPPWLPIAEFMLAVIPVGLVFRKELSAYFQKINPLKKVMRK